MTILDIDPGDIESRPGPRYRAIADAIADVADRFPAGTKLPPMRALAYELDVTVGTVSRAYALAVQEGHVVSEVGRGTFVKGAPTEETSDWRGETRDETHPLAMKVALAPEIGQSEKLRRSMADFLARMQAQAFNGYLAGGGTPAHRAAAASWMARGSFTPQADDMLVCSGAQQAILTALLAATAPGDIVLVEELTFRASAVQAGAIGRQVVPVAIDGEGLVPAALEDAIARHRPSALICVPSLHNPTCAVMGPARRQRIAEIVKAAGLAIIEDDVYGAYLDAPPPPISAFAPDHTFFVSSLSKSVACGLRFGFLRPPARYREACRGLLYGLGQTVPLVMADFCTGLIESGEAAAILELVRAEARRRQALACEKLDRLIVGAHPQALYVWLDLGGRWTAHGFAEAARARGLDLATADEFSPVPSGPAARHVRLAVSQPPRLEDLGRALESVNELVAAGPCAAPTLV